MNPMDEFLELVQKPQGQFLEYVTGQVKTVGRKYLQRYGIPGHFKYIYSNPRMERMSRKIRWAYTRMTNNARVFINKLATHYEASHFGIKQKTWHTAIIDITTRNNDIFQFHVNLASHGIYSYKSKRTSGMGAASKLGRAKKRGILRAR